MRADRTMKFADKADEKDREINPEAVESREAPACENKRIYLVIRVFF